MWKKVEKMDNQKIELGRYHNCLYEIKRRIDVIKEHLTGETREKYLIIEVEIICLQFRKILEMISLMSLVANKELYSKQNEKYAKHYHAERIMRDLERINPDFYPEPIRRVKVEGDYDRIEKIEEGFLTKEEFVEIYEKCGGMMHAQNPFGSPKPFEEIRENFREWLDKICILVAHHQIVLVGGELILVAILERSDNGLPQAVIFESINGKENTNR